jgi:hypothetical protein
MIYRLGEQGHKALQVDGLQRANHRCRTFTQIPMTPFPSPHMIRFKLASAVAVLSLVAVQAGAQSVVTAQLTAPYAPNAGAATAFGYYMSPYSGTVDGVTERLNCVDFFHEVTVGEVWSATTVNLGAAITAAGTGDWSLLSYTRDGSNGLYPPSTALTIYEQVAFLTTQYAVNPGSNPLQTTAIQTAIWAIADNQPNSAFTNTGNTVGSLNSSSTDVNSTGYWINQAQTMYDQQGAGYYDQFNILTDVNHATAAGGVQEFVYATPEPGTLTLIGTGLMMMSGVGFRRRRKNGGDLDLGTPAIS